MPRQASDSFKRKVTFYDADFNQKEDFAEGKITAAKSISEATGMLGDESEVLKALNQVIRVRQVAAAVAAKSGGMEVRYINGFIKSMRLMAPYNEIEKESDQTKAILDMVKTVPVLLNGLKSYCELRAKDEAEGQDSED